MIPNKLKNIINKIKNESSGYKILDEKVDGIYIYEVVFGNGKAIAYILEEDGVIALNASNNNVYSLMRNIEEAKKYVDL